MVLGGRFVGRRGRRRRGRGDRVAGDGGRGGRRNRDDDGDGRDRTETGSGWATLPAGWIPSGRGSRSGRVGSSSGDGAAPGGITAKPAIAWDNLHGPLSRNDLRDSHLNRLAVNTFFGACPEPRRVARILLRRPNEVVAQRRADEPGYGGWSLRARGFCRGVSCLPAASAEPAGRAPPSRPAPAAATAAAPESTPPATPDPFSWAAAIARVEEVRGLGGPHHHPDRAAALRRPPALPGRADGGLAGGELRPAA